MIELTDRSFFCCDGVDRRSFLRVGFLGLGSLTFPDILAHRAQAGVAQRKTFSQLGSNCYGVSV